MTTCIVPTFNVLTASDILGACGTSSDVLSAVVKAERDGNAFIGTQELVFMAYAHDAETYEPATGIYKLFA